MLNQAQKMRANWQSGKSGGGQNDRLYAKKQTEKSCRLLFREWLKTLWISKKRSARLERSTSQVTKMPSKNNDDDSDDENELNQFESLSINGADDNEESSSDSSNNWSSGRESSSKECNSLDQMIDVNLSLRGS